MTHKGEHCTVFLSDLEHLADEATRHILSNPHATPEYLRACLHGWFVQAQGMGIPERIEPITRSIICK